MLRAKSKFPFSVALLLKILRPMQVGCGLDYRGVTGSLLSQLSIWCTRCTCAFIHITGAKEPHNIERVLLFLPWHTSIEWSSATWLANKVMWHQKRTYLFHESGVCTCQCTHKIGQLSAYPLKWFPNNALWTSHCMPWSCQPVQTIVSACEQR